MPVLLLLLLMILVTSGAAVARGIHECGELVVVSPMSIFTGGFSSSCFKQKAVTFDTCKRLLLSREKEGCNALSYSHYNCSLHDRTSPSWQPISIPVATPPAPRDDNENSNNNNKNKKNEGRHKISMLQMLLLSPDIDFCTSPSADVTLDHPQQGGSSLLAKNDLPACLQDPLLAQLSQTTGTAASTGDSANAEPPGLHNWLALPRLGIIMAVTSDWMSDYAKEMSSLVDNWKCYARTHNYDFHLHIMKQTSVVEKFYHTRHGDITDTYLHKYRYLLVLDSDNLVVNMSRSLDHIVNATPLDQSHPYAAVDVFLHMREGGEVTASTYFIRNSAFSRCFVQYWRSMAPSDFELEQASSPWIETPNNDNGDLIATVMNLIDPVIALKCSAAMRPHTHNSKINRHQIYNTKILLCFRLFRGALVNITHYVPQLKVFFIREDFFRMHTGHTMTKENMLLQKDAYCHQHDVIVHGWKDLGSRYWPLSSDDKQKTQQYPSCDVDVFRKGGGGNSVCRWLKHEVELSIVRKHCYWRSPLCTMSTNSSRISTNSDINHSIHVNNNNSTALQGRDPGDMRPPSSIRSENKNTCVQDEHRGGVCWERERMNLMRWSLCLRHQVCDPYLKVAMIRTKFQPLYQLSSPW